MSPLNDHSKITIKASDKQSKRIFLNVLFYKRKLQPKFQLIWLPR